MVAESAPHSTPYNASHAFDGEWSAIEYRWLAKLDANNNPAYLVYGFKEATVVDGVRLRSWNSSTRAPKAWTFEGSNDLDSWTLLDTRSSVTGWQSTGAADFGFTNRNAYKYYKISITESNGDDMYIQLGEIQFLVGCLDKLATTAAGAVFE